MDFEGLAELLVPLALFGIIGGLVALRMLKPYGDKILELVKEIQKDRHQALSETRELQNIRDRLDMLAERQDFLESLVERRLDESEQEELERIRRRSLGRAAGRQVGQGAAGDEHGEAGSDEAPGSSAGGSGSPAGGSTA